MGLCSKEHECTDWRSHKAARDAAMAAEHVGSRAQLCVKPPCNAATVQRRYSSHIACARPGRMGGRVDPAEQAALLHALRVTSHVPAEGAAGAEAPRDGRSSDANDEASAEGAVRGAPRRRVEDTSPPQPGAFSREIYSGAGFSAHAPLGPRSLRVAAPPAATLALARAQTEEDALQAFDECAARLLNTAPARIRVRRAALGAL